MRVEKMRIKMRILIVKCMVYKTGTQNFRGV